MTRLSAPSTRTNSFLYLAHGYSLTLPDVRGKQYTFTHMTKYTRIVKGMADKDYRAEIGISQSMLKPMFTSPLHYQHQFNVEREVTKPMLIGTATHLACFQPKQFAEEVVVSKKFDLRKTQDKLDSAQFQPVPKMPQTISRHLS
jgi:hypothetical protein